MQLTSGSAWGNKRLQRNAMSVGQKNSTIYDTGGAAVGEKLAAHHLGGVNLITFRQRN